MSAGSAPKQDGAGTSDETTSSSQTNQESQGQIQSQSQGQNQGNSSASSSATQNNTTCNINNLENIKVSVRLRPFTERERQRHSKRIVDIEQNTVALYNPKFPDEAAKKFTFDHSYWSHDGFKRNQEGVNVPDPEHPNSSKYVSQERVFADLGRFLLDNALQGYNSALLAYGQTGSGKSYTVSGYGQNEGILPRFARELFAELDKKLALLNDSGQSSATLSSSQQQQLLQPESAASPSDATAAAASGARSSRRNRYEVYFSMIEIYNEVVRDLLAKQNGYNSQTANSIVRRGLRVREHPKKGFFVESLSSYPCASKDEIESLIEEGQMNKSIAATSMNETSSRGHTIYEFTIRQFKLKEEATGGGPPDTTTASTATGSSSSPPPPRSPPTPTRSRARTPVRGKGELTAAATTSNTSGGAGTDIETLTTSVVQLVDLAGSERMTVHVTGELGGTSSDALLNASARPTSRAGSPFNGTTNGPDPFRGSTRSVRGAAGSVRRAAAVAPPPNSASSSSSTATAAGGGGSSQSTTTRRQQAQQYNRGMGPGSQANNLLGPNSMNLMNSNHQQRFKESVSINQSLSALGNCIQVLSQFSQQQQLTQDGSSGGGGGASGKQPKIPYRDSVLTKLLNRCCLSGNSKVVLIATLSPADANYDDTLSTLRFADRAKQIRTHAVINRSVGESGVIGLQRENERLKQILDGRVTRSDDSSQTSNFDDSENMQDNFNGPKVEVNDSPTGKQSQQHQQQQKAERAYTVTRTRASTKAAAAQTSTTVGVGNSKRQPRSNLRLAQENLLSSKQQHHQKQDTAETVVNHHSSQSNRVISRVTPPTGSKSQRVRGHGAAAAAVPPTKLVGSSSNPTLAAADQMEQLVSSAKKKMRQKSRAAGGNDLAAGRSVNGLDGGTHSDEELGQAGRGDQEQEDDGDETSNERQLMRKSRSLGQGLADSVGNGELEFRSELLDEIDLNELADIIDDENLLSPDSDDSFTNGGAGAGGTSRAKFDENMSNEEKAAILNRLLSNSSVANKIIRKQIESSISGTSGGIIGSAVSKMTRPKKAGAKQHLRPAKRGELAASSGASKQTNPFLSNLNPDEQLTGMITYILDEGEMIVGKDESCDLLIYGPGVRGQHAKLIRVKGSKAESSGSSSSEKQEQDATSECYIEPIILGANDAGSGEGVTPTPTTTAALAPVQADQVPKQAGKQLLHQASQAKRVAVLVNGEPVLKRTRLNHGDRLLFGSTNYFVFVDSNTGAPPDSVTYDMAHAEVMRMMMSESENDAMIKEIKDYTHRPGTGKKRSRDLEDSSGQGVGVSVGNQDRTSQENGNNSVTTTDKPITHEDKLQRQQQQQLQQQPQQQQQQQQQLDNIKEEDGSELSSGNNGRPDNQDELYRDKLMADTYEFAMPIAEANAIANEMGIKVTYGLKILTGEEQLEPLLMLDEMLQTDNDSQLGSDGSGANNNNNSSGQQEGAQEEEGEEESTIVDERHNHHHNDRLATLDEQRRASNVVISTREPIKPDTLDIPPELYVHVHLDELQLDFYWSKEKFQERRVKMLELYGAWDVGGKSGLVEYLIEQSKYQGYYMIDPFVDDIRSSWVLVGHAQVTLQPVSHVASLRESFDLLDVDDEIVGSVLIEALPCHCDATPEDDPMSAEWPYKPMDEHELATGFLEDPNKLLDRRFVFLLRIVSCSSVPQKFAQVFCQYTLNREQTIVRTKLARRELADSISEDQSKPESNDNPDAAGSNPASSSFHYDHKHFIVIDRVGKDILDFLRHGFLTIQLVGQYDTTSLSSSSGGGSGAGSMRRSTAESSTAGGGGGSSSGAYSSSAGRRQSQRPSSHAQPTLVSTIISSINKYRFRMEQQSAAYQNLGALQQYGHNQNQSVYANSLSDSANSAQYRLASSSVMNSNSGPSSVTSASATINLFDQQNDDDEGTNSLNGANQENIIDMILTKRKLDRAENQLHYIKRTINIAEHHNKKHIPVRTVKKLLNSYGQELEGGSLEEMAAEVTAEAKSSDTKHSNCTIQ